MIRKILIHSYLQLINNNKLTKVVLFSLFAHSLIAVFIIIFNSYMMIEKEFELNSTNEVIKYAINLFSFDHIGRVSVWLAIFLFFGYFVFSPIGEYIIIHHLHTEESINKSLNQWFSNFHHIAKYDGMTFMFSVTLFIRFLIESIIYEVNNWIVMVLFVFWFLMVGFVTTLLQYTKTIIVVEWLAPFESMKRSIEISMEHLWTTLKLVGISLIFGLRMIFNILFIVGIPLSAIVIFQFFWRIWWFGDAVVYILFFWIFLFIAYVNTLIEWYFRIFRYISYEYILGNTEQLEKLWIIRINNDQSLGGLFGDDAQQPIHQDVDEMKLLDAS